MSALSVEQFKEALPARLKKSVNKELIDKMNVLLHDPDMHEVYRENLMSYTHVMQDGKFRLTNYIDAVKYVSQKLMGRTNMAAFTVTFPDKITDWTVRKVLPKDMASYVTAYNKSKMVTLIMEQSLVPSWILNQDNFQKAINTQVDLMQRATSEKVRSDAANSIMTHLKMPESQKVELSVATNEDSSISALRDATSALTEQLRTQIQAGQLTAQEVAHAKITYDNETGESV